jgi:hypothetical protein
MHKGISSLLPSVLSRSTIPLQRFNRCALLIATFFAALLFAGAPANASEMQVLSGHVPNAVNSSRVLREMPRATRMNLAIGLPLRNQDELESLLTQLSDPSSPNFRHYLSPQQFAEKFGPTEQDYQALIRHVTENGLVVTGTHLNRVLLDVSGEIPDVERLLHVKMMFYKHPVRGEFYAPDREPSLDTDVKTLDISGLDNFELPHPMGLTKVALNKATPYVTGSGPGGYFIGKDFRAAYAPGVTLTGSGQYVGLMELDGFYAGDVTKNFAQAGLPAVPVQTVLLDGFNGAPGSANIEVMLDIMMASYMAPGLKAVVVYEGYYPNDVLNRMATDNLAQQLSSSWGFGINATTEQIFKQYIAQGQSLMQASGDDGAYTNGVMTPSDDPNLTVVGGTSLSTSGAGGPWQAESAWSGSGGGISTTYTIPSYQQGFNMSASGGSTKMRNIPDLALTADIQMYLIQNNGQAVVVGGTSAAAPLWAGFVALANQQATTNSKPRIGFLNPLVYAIGNSSNYNVDFNDITRGSNGYSAVTGYDLATGWGSPAGQHLINDLTGISTGASFVLSSSVSTLSMKQASTGSATLTVSPKNGFSGSVTLAVTGLPTGVTAGFSPAAATTTSTLTLTSNSSVISGIYPLTITGTSGSLTSSTTISLTVIAPSFSFAASPTSLTVSQGTTGSSTLSISGQNSFNGTVSFAVAGLPTGVTAAFSPATATTSTVSKVTFAVSSSVVGGTYPLTINATSSALTSTTTMSLTVVVPSFSLAASPTSITVPQGGSGTNTISVSGQNGFSGSVNFTLTGLPTGVSATFTPATATTSTASKVTLNVGATVPAGTYPLTIKGVSGTLSSTAAIGLAVVVPSFSLAASPTSITVPQGSSGSNTISVNGQNGFSGSVSFTVAGLPTGVTAAFTPATATTSTASKVTFTVGVSAPAGTYPLTINGTSGTLKSTTPISLTVVVPSFSLATPAANLTVPQGGSGSNNVSVSGQNGFNGTVSFAVTGLPRGVTASFTPATATTTSPSKVNITAGSTAPSGTYVLTITGTSGTLTSTTTMGLTVVVPNFSLTTSANNLTIPQSGSGSSTISVSGQNGFVGSVSLAATGLPTGVTATFSPTSTSSTSAMTLSASSTVTPGTYSVTITGTSGTLKNITTISLVISAPNFALSAQPAALALPYGLTGSGTVTVTALNGFKGIVSLTASGLPPGVTVSFGAVSATGTSQVTFTIGSSATAGSFPIVITGVSGSLKNSASMTLTVLAPTAGTSTVNLAPAYNVNALVADGLPFTGGGLDGGLNGSSTAYSASLIGVQQTIGGTLFYFGPANALDAVSAKSITLPSGQFSAIKLLTTGVNGNQLSQIFKVTYTDGTSSSFTQNVSDWFTPQKFVGETIAMIMPYRDNGQGQIDNRTFYLYQYTFTLATGKTVASITLPNNRNVVTLAATLIGTSTAVR